MQQHKNDFLTRDGLNNTSYVSGAIATPRSPYEVKAGTVIPLSLITGINSDLPGQIVGQVRENVYDTVTGNYLLIPQGSRLIATYDSSVTFGHRPHAVQRPRSLAMSANDSEVPDGDHDQVVVEALELAARFPEVHQICDCISTVRHVAGLFGKIITPDGHNVGATPDLDPRSLAQDPTYSLTDADKISKKLRRLARSRGTKPVLTTLQLLGRLWPEIKALLDDGYYPQLADVLSKYGVDVSALSQPPVAARAHRPNPGDDARSRRKASEPAIVAKAVKTRNISSIWVPAVSTGVVQPVFSVSTAPWTIWSPMLSHWQAATPSTPIATTCQNLAMSVQRYWNSAAGAARPLQFHVGRRRLHFPLPSCLGRSSTSNVHSSWTATAFRDRLETSSPEVKRNG